jgi:hypothetical protein
MPVRYPVTPPFAHTKGTGLEPALPAPERSIPFYASSNFFIEEKLERYLAFFQTKRSIPSRRLDFRTVPSEEELKNVRPGITGC